MMTKDGLNPKVGGLKKSIFLLTLQILDLDPNSEWAIDDGNEEKKKRRTVRKKLHWHAVDIAGLDVGVDVKKRY